MEANQIPSGPMTAGWLGHSVLDVAVRYGYCMGCGVCAAACPAKSLEMQENRYSELVPTDVKPCASSCSVCRDVCPMDANDDEDVLGQRLFEHEPGIAHSDLLGWFHSTYVGGLADKTARLNHASGGLTTAVLAGLLRTGEVDAVIAPVPMNKRPWFETRILETEESIYASRGSAYHTVHFADALGQVMHGSDRNYAMVALPCVAKAVRLAQERLPRFEKRVKYVIGLACGSCHSFQFPDLLRGMMGNPEGTMNYRAKRSPSCGTFTLEILGKRGTRVLKNAYQLAKFRGCSVLNACRFCDDLSAELADVTFMDAWLPEYVTSQYGTTLAVSRRAAMSRLISATLSSSSCEGRTIPSSDVERSLCRTTVFHRKRRLIAARVALPDLPAFVPHKRVAASIETQESLRLEAQNERTGMQLSRELLARNCPSIVKSNGAVARARAWVTFVRLFHIWKRHYPAMAGVTLIGLLPHPGIRTALRRAVRGVLRVGGFRDDSTERA